MILSPYQTKACKDYQTDKIAKAILEREISGRGFNNAQTAFKFSGGNSNSENPVYIITSDQDIPAFAHPLKVTNPVYNRMAYYVDVRPFVRVDREGNVRVSAYLDHMTAVWRGLLSGYWDFISRDDFRALGDFPVKVFSQWLANAMTFRLALPPEVQINVHAITAYYYLCLHSEEVERNDAYLLKMAGMISRATRIATDKVMDIIQNIDHMKNLDDYIAALVEHSGSTRFENFNAGLLYSLVSGAWFGANSREIIAVSLEHPPTFVTLVAMSLEERGYRRSGLGRLTEQLDKRGEGALFLKTLKRLPV